MKAAKTFALLVCVLAPFLLAGYALVVVPDGWQSLRDANEVDWLWAILLGALVVGMYYFLAVYIEDEKQIAQEFERLDRDHDGFINREDASSWPELVRSFDRFDTDHDGRLSCADFDAFEHALLVR